jgi:hypothetical protein
MTCTGPGESKRYAERLTLSMIAPTTAAQGLIMKTDLRSSGTW